jgi:hypothetical protein
MWQSASKWAAAGLEVLCSSEAKEEFWDRLGQEVFPSLLKQKKWYKYKRHARVGDVVLRKDETADGKTYKYARIINVHVGPDGKIRSTDVEYKLPGESKLRVSTRPIHKLVLIVPVEEQTMEGSVDPKEREMRAGEERSPFRTCRPSSDG